MEFILTSLESSRLAAQDPWRKDHHHDHDDNLNSDSLQESFDTFAEALRRFVLDLDDNDGDGDGRQTSTPTRQHAATSAAVSASASSSASALPAGKPSRITTAKKSLTAATWLYETCSRVPSPLPTLQLALEVLSAVNRAAATGQQDDDDSSKVQSSLFELFGEGEQSIDALFEVMGKLDSLRKDVTEMDLRSVAESKGEGNAALSSAAPTTAAAASSSTQRLEQLQQLRAEAYAAADLATALRTDLNSIKSTSNYASRGTHSVTRKSDKDAEKAYKRAIKQALNAVNKAREAGALTEYDDLFLKDQLSSNFGSYNNLSAMEQMMLRNEEAMLYHAQRGLDGMTPQQIANMKHDLLPEGTRVYDDGSLRGLPAGTEREVKEGKYEKVTIPARVLDKSQLRSRINLDEVLGIDTDERAAFVGTKSLNPMQSTVFDAAYNTRENLLICAPTGKSDKGIATCRPAFCSVFN